MITLTRICTQELDEFLTPGSHVAVYEDQEGFVKQIRHYLENATEREEIARCGRDHVRSHFSYDSVVREIQRVFEELYSSPSELP